MSATLGEALRALQEIKQVFPEMQSINTDSDILWTYHVKLERLIGVPFYFCHPYSSWEKGGVENYNKQARHYVKKGSDISQYDDTYLQMVETKLNSRYMAVLEYQTPTGALVAYRKEKLSRLGATSAYISQYKSEHSVGRERNILYYMIMAKEQSRLIYSDFQPDRPYNQREGGNCYVDILTGGEQIALSSPIVRGSMAGKPMMHITHDSQRGYLVAERVFSPNLPQDDAIDGFALDGPMVAFGGEAAINTLLLGPSVLSGRFYGGDEEAMKQSGYIYGSLNMIRHPDRNLAHVAIFMPMRSTYSALSQLLVERTVIASLPDEI